MKLLQKKAIFKVNQEYFYVLLLIYDMENSLK